MGSAGVGWRALMDGLRDGMVLADRQDRLVHINPSACRLLDCTAEHLVGRPIETLFPERLRRVSGQPLQRFLLARGKERDVPLHVPALRTDGVEVVVECTVSEAVDDDGESLIVILFRQAPEETAFAIDEMGLVRSIPASERRYQLVFEHAPLGIFHFDEGGVLTACNDRFVAIIGSPKRMLVGLDMTTLPNEAIVACLREATAGRHAHYDGDYRSATSGKVTPVHVQFAPISDAQQRVTGGVGIVEDVTERKEAERALARAERMASLGTLAAGVAHEINNPLTYVITSIEVARARLGRLRSAAVAEKAAHGQGEHAAGLWEETDEALANAHEGADRVRLIVRDLKTFVRADDEKPHAVDVQNVLEAAIKLVWNEVRHRAQLIREFAAVPPVWGNEARLVQVFVNLLANAAQAIPEGDVDNQRITVRTAADREEHVCIEIEDTGVGIAPGDLERIFEPFWSDRPVGSGTGLGLSIVHGIVTSLGGSISVSSELDRGTLFRVLLPRAEARADGPPPQAEEEDDSSVDRRARILVIDDEARLAQTVRLALKPRHDVISCTSGSDAIELLRRDDDFDLILCDLALPDTSGPEIYEALRDEHPSLVARFVFMTGGAFTARSREFLREVDNPRLEKPFRIEEIERLLRTGSRAALRASERP